MNTIDRATKLGRAFDAGNFDSAYGRHSRYGGGSRWAYVLGYFSSYERHEIPEHLLDEYAAAVEWSKTDPDWALTGISVED